MISVVYCIRLGAKCLLFLIKLNFFTELKIFESLKSHGVQDTSFKLPTCYLVKDSEQGNLRK